MTSARISLFLLGLIGILAAASGNGIGRAGKEVSVPRFDAEEIDQSLKVGYAVLLTDLNGDGKRDIVVVDTTRVIWFENPTWKKRVIIQGQTKPDNVCIDAYDIDGDGQLDLALGAGWKGLTSQAEGTLQWLKRGQTLDEPWTVHPIDTEPSIHRIRFADLDQDGKAELVSVPLLGRSSTQGKNWMDGEPVRIHAYRIPKDPTRDRWIPTILDQSLHVVHNFTATNLFGQNILTASYEGVHLFYGKRHGTWQRIKLGEGNQENPQGSRGASEIKMGRLCSPVGEKDAVVGKFLATIEPWHGHQVVIYTPPAVALPEALQKPWHRQVIDDQLKWGHAVWCADLDGDRNEEVIVGVRDDLNSQARRGVRIYRAVDQEGRKWERHLIDHGDVAVEDLAAADLNNDGRIDIVAVGRATGNVKIYWNKEP